MGFVQASGESDKLHKKFLKFNFRRFIFASGAVKLASGCPHWWNLSALKHHLLTLPLPTHLAFYSYYIPDGYLKLTVVFVQLSELLCPWLFFAPIRSLRIFAFYWHVFLQLCVIATGNYGFLNFLVLVMLLSLLDDSHFKSTDTSNGVNFKKVFSFILTMAAVFIIMVITMTFYQISFTDGSPDVSICKILAVIFEIIFVKFHQNLISVFTKEQYMDILRQMIKLAPFIATISMINVFLQSCISHPIMVEAKGFFSKLSKIIHLLALTMVAISLIGCSTVPHGNLHPETNIANTTIGKAYEDVFHKYHIVHEYGQHLRKMRSERLELGLQYTYSDNIDKPMPKMWQEYITAYRPSNKNHSLPYAGLYFSRLDFKFHEAIGKGAKLENNLWLANFVKQLLRNNQAAVMLLGHENILKLKTPPTFVRVAFMRVSYVPREDSDKNAGLWTRKILNASYLPPMSLTGKELTELIKKLNFPTQKEKETYPKLLSGLRQIRLFLEAADGHLMVNGIIIASLIIMFRLRRR